MTRAFKSATVQGRAMAILLFGSTELIYWIDEADVMGANIDEFRVSLCMLTCRTVTWRFNGQNA